MHYPRHRRNDRRRRRDRSAGAGADAELLVTRYGGTHQNLTDTVGDVADYTVLRGDPGMANGAPVGRAYMRNVLAADASRVTCAGPTDLKALQSIDTAPPADTRDGPLLASLMATGDVDSGQAMWGSLIPASGDCTWLFFHTPKGAGNGAVIEWDNQRVQGDGIQILTVFANTRWRLKSVNANSASGTICQSNSNVLVADTDYMTAVTYDATSGAMKMRHYEVGNSTAVDTDTGTTTTGLDMSDPHKLGVGNAQGPTQDFDRVVTYQEVLSDAAIDAIAGGGEIDATGTPVRDFNGVRTGVVDPDDETRLLWAEGTGHPVRLGDHPSFSQIAGLSGQSLSIGGGGYPLIDTANKPLGFWYPFDTAQATFDTTPGDAVPGIEQYLLGEDDGAALRGFIMDGVAGSTLAQHISTYGPRWDGYVTGLGAEDDMPFLVFWQGSAEAAAPGAAATYQTDLGTYCAARRAALGRPNLPIFIVELVTINDGTDTSRTEHATVRAAQNAYVATDDNAYLIDTSDVTIANGHVGPDGVHTNNSGNAVVAARVLTQAQALGHWL